MSATTGAATQQLSRSTVCRLLIDQELSGVYF